jgi:MFS family permease
VVSWVEAAGIAAAGSLTGVLIWLGGVASVFAVCAALGAVAAVVVFRLQVPALGAPEEHAPPVAAGLSASMRLAVRQPRLRLMLALLAAEAAVVGALDLLFVILAVTVLGRSQAWAGYLNSAYGMGAILAATVSVLLVGRRLGCRSWAQRSCSWRARRPRGRPGPGRDRGPAHGRRGEPCPAGRC